MENRKHCIEIARILEAINEGRVYRCPECGEFITEGDKICHCCKAEIDLDDCEQASFFDYFTDSAFDIEYRIGSDRAFRSARIMVACGGPNIFVDTGAREIQLYWWTDRASCPIDPEACEAINECFEELYNC